MNFGYSDSNIYTGRDYSFGAFFGRYRTTGTSKIIDTELTTKNGKKLIMTTYDKTSSDTTAIKEKMNVIFFYPFKTESGDLKAYQYSFDLPSRSTQYTTLMQKLFEMIEFPGISPFTK